MRYAFATKKKRLCINNIIGNTGRNTFGFKYNIVTQIIDKSNINFYDLYVVFVTKCLRNTLTGKITIFFLPVNICSLSVNILLQTKVQCTEMLFYYVVFAFMFIGRESFKFIFFSIANTQMVCKTMKDKYIKLSNCFPCVAKKEF